MSFDFEKLKRISDMRPVQFGLWLVLLAEGLVAMWLSRPWIGGDSGYYLELGEAVCHGHYGTVTAAGFQPDVLRPPGYPILLCVLRHALGLPIAAIVLLQVGAYLLSMFVLTRVLVRRRYSPTLMLLLAIAYPASIMYGTQVMTEPWTQLALAVAVLVLERRGVEVRPLILAGLLCGVAAYFRADLLPVPFFLGLFILIDAIRSKVPLLRSVARAGLPILTAAALLLPYAVWNEANFKWPLPAPIAGAVGTSLYLATWQGKLPNDELSALYHGVLTPRAKSLGLGDEVHAINQRVGADPLTAPWSPTDYATNTQRLAVNRATADMAIKRITADPDYYAGHVLGNTWRLWQANAFPPSLPWAAVALIQIASWLIFIFGCVGIVLSFVRPREWPLSPAPAAILLTVPAVHIWLHTEARYTAAVRPILLLLAAATMSWAANKLLKRRSDRAGTAPSVSRSPHS